ncbi:TPA: hypothetical protein I7730_20480 [Vibrio vulnificus]|uniref:Bacterial type II secretion system protein E domain-containing protein n=1 Tax=Vibrio vulnificus TaxID=672 RepID=A0A8H9TH95_VIBVL|nr:hypothetical protein [Vibrio vulnificus]
MLKRIENVSDLGPKWKLIGAKGGDTSVIKTQERYLSVFSVVSVSVKEEGGIEKEIIMMLGSKSFLRSKIGYGYLETLKAHYGEPPEIRPIESGKFFTELYKEWEGKRKTETSLSGNKKEDVKEYDNVKEADKLVSKMMKEGVSDIHLEVREETGVFRKRINSLLVPHDSVSPAQGLSWANTFFNVLTESAKTDFNRKEVQDAVFEREIHGQKIRGRIATSPIGKSGFDVVIRLIPVSTDSKPVSLQKLNYSEQEIKRIEIATNKPSGMIIICGTTGSGKSTTLKNLLMMQGLKARNMNKIITVEDPVEYYIPNASQITVMRDKDGKSTQFHAAGRAALRQDPDIIMIGEIRDAVTAELAKEACQSGHPLYTTLHASSCFGAIPRLEAIGVGRDVLASENFLAGTIYQKLLPKVCDKCAVTASDNMIPIRMNEIDVIGSLRLMTDEKALEWEDIYKKDAPKTNFVRFLQDNEVINASQADSIVMSFEEYNSKEKRQEAYDRIASVANLKSDKILFKGSGCSHCNGTGVIGRVPASESMVFDLNMREMIGRSSDSELVNYWKKNMGGKETIEDAIMKMRRGLIDPMDVEHHIDYLTTVSG